MGIANVSAINSISAAITSNSSQVQNGKVSTSGKTLKSDFMKLLEKKSTTTTDDAMEINDSLNQLVVLLSNLQTNISSEDKANKITANLEDESKLVLKDSTDDETSNLISSLSLLLNQLNSKLQTNEIDLTTNTNSSEELSKIDSISSLVAKFKTQVPKQIDDEKQSDSSDSKIKNSNDFLNSTRQFTTGVGVDNAISYSSIQVNDNEAKKLENVLKSLTQVITNPEEQVSLNKTNQNIETSIKTQLLKSTTLDNDVNEVLQNNSNKGSVDMSQSLINLGIRAGNQNDLSIDSIGNNKVSTKDIKEIRDLVDKVLSTVKSVGTDTILKTDDITKLQVVLKNLNQVVIDDEKQISLDKVNQNVQSFVKQQILLSTTSNDDSGKQESSTENSKTNAAADKVLQKIANKDNSDKIQSFTNLLSRASNQNDISMVKSTESLVINKDNLVNDVIKTVKYMNVNDIKDLTVKITPKDLGEVTIKLTQDGSGVMKASITTSNKEAFQLVNSNLQELNNKITSNNMSIQSFSVDVFNGESSMFKQGTQQNKESKQGRNKSSSSIDAQDDVSVDAIAYSDSNVNILV